MSRSISALVYVALAIIALPCAVKAQNSSHFLPMDEKLTPLNSSTGRSMLCKSTASEAYWTLTQFYAIQPDLATCSVATSTAILNSLPIERPLSMPHGPYRLFTSRNFFSPEVERVVSREKVLRSGMTLDQLASALRTYSVRVEQHYASDSEVEAFRNTVRRALKQSAQFVVVNYLRKAINQKSGGHISPLGAYNDEHDSVLILDTSAYKYPWTWVKVDDLFSAMAKTVDSESGRSRGYLVVSPMPK